MKSFIIVSFLILNASIINLRLSAKDTNYIEPKLTLSSYVDYIDCTYVLVSASFPVDSVIKNDNICWVIEDEISKRLFFPNYSNSGGG